MIKPGGKREGRKWGSRKRGGGGGFLTKGDVSERVSSRRERGWGCHGGDGASTSGSM